MHHHCLLVGYGADAINPYLAFEALWQAQRRRLAAGRGQRRRRSCRAYRKAVAKGMLKVMAQDGHLDAAELQGRADLRGRRPERRGDRPLLRRHRQPHPGRRASTCWPRKRCAATRSAIRRAEQTGCRRCPIPASSTGGPRAKRHMWDPQAIADLQVAARDNSGDAYRAVRRARQRKTRARAARLRGLLEVQARRTASRFRSTRSSRPSEIVKRFCTGAMSFGSISAEAHETLAIAMNRIGGKSNTGEGGEDPERFKPLPNGDSQALGDQAGRVGPLRRHDLVPGQRRRAADQDGAGREARRRRRAARPEGRRHDRAHSLLDARRGPHQPAAASRHLFDRGPRAADPRSEERQSRRRASA